MAFSNAAIAFGSALFVFDCGVVLDFVFVVFDGVREPVSSLGVPGSFGTLGGCGECVAVPDVSDIDARNAAYSSFSS